MKRTQVAPIAGRTGGRDGGRAIAIRPVRQIQLQTINERSVGGLMMHFMLETILMGRLMGVDPFDQPGVEEGKVLARQYLDEQT